MAEDEDRRAQGVTRVPETGHAPPSGATETPAEAASTTASSHEPGEVAAATAGAGSYEAWETSEARPGEAAYQTNVIEPAPEDAQTPVGSTAAGPTPELTSPQAATGARSNGTIPAVIGIVLLILAISVGYLIYADQNRGEQHDPATAELTNRVAALEARQTPDLTALNNRLDAATKDIAALKQDLAALKARPVEAAAAPSVEPAIQALDAKVADVGQGLADVRTALAAIPKVDLSPVEARIGDLGQHIETMQRSVSDLTPLPGKLEAIDARLKPVEAEVQAAAAPARVAERQAAPLAVTAEAVRRAVDSGRPFADDLAALQRLGADAKDLAALQAVAANGAPTTADLRADLTTLRDTMLASSAPAPSGSYLDRIMAGAGSLVHVRPLGSVVGDTPGAIVARMDGDLAADNLGQALEEWSKLPEATRTASKGLADRIRLRLSAQTAASHIGAAAIQAMTVSKP